MRSTYLLTLLYSSALILASSSSKPSSTNPSVKFEAEHILEGQLVGNQLNKPPGPFSSTSKRPLSTKLQEIIHSILSAKSPKPEPSGDQDGKKAFPFLKFIPENLPAAERESMKQEWHAKGGLWIDRATGQRNWGEGAVAPPVNPRPSIFGAAGSESEVKKALRFALDQNLGPEERREQLRQLEERYAHLMRPKLRGQQVEKVKRALMDAVYEEDKDAIMPNWTPERLQALWQSINSNAGRLPVPVDLHARPGKMNELAKRAMEVFDELDDEEKQAALTGWKKTGFNMFLALADKIRWRGRRDLEGLGLHHEDIEQLAKRAMDVLEDLDEDGKQAALKGWLKTGFQLIQALADKTRWGRRDLEDLDHDELLVQLSRRAVEVFEELDESDKQAVLTGGLKSAFNVLMGVVSKLTGRDLEAVLGKRAVEELQWDSLDEEGKQAVLTGWKKTGFNLLMGLAYKITGRDLEDLE